MLRYILSQTEKFFFVFKLVNAVSILLQVLSHQLNTLGQFKEFKRFSGSVCFDSRIIFKRFKLKSENVHLFFSVLYNFFQKYNLDI